MAAEQDKDAPFPLQSSSPTKPDSKGVSVPDLRDVEFQHIRRTNDQSVGPKEAKRVVINSWNDYDKFFDNQERERPQVDFTREELIAVSMGEKTSDGYAIEIVSIKHGAGFGLIRTYVEFVEKKPKPGQGLEDVMTYPADVVKVKKLPGTTEFTEVESKGEAA